MFRPFLRVARPDDWTGRLAAVGTGVVLVILVLASLMARLPEAWVAWAGGHPIVVRGILVLLSAWVVAWMRAIVFSRLPAAPYLVGGRVVVPVREENLHLSADDVADVHVELRPEPVREALVIELHDGRVFDVCPVHWDGAGRLYRGLARKVRRARRRAVRSARS